MEDLVKKAKSGDKEAYAELFSLVYNDLYKTALSILNDPSDAKDAIQNTYVSAFRSLHTLTNDKSFKSWIIKILKNKCNNIFRNRNYSTESLEDYPASYGNTDGIDDKLSFDDMLKFLNEKEQRVFRLKFEDGLTIKQISKLLNMNENTIKTILSRGKKKLRQKIKPSVFVLILCAVITTVVLGACLYIKSLFDTNSVGKNNDGMLYAVENLDWYQKIDMDYIDVDENSKIKLEYISMDEMSLYMIFNFCSKKDINNVEDISITDLVLTNESGLTICNTIYTQEKQYNMYVGFKPIGNDNHNIKFLLYMYNNSFPISKFLNLSFSKIALVLNYMNREFVTSDFNINFDITLSEKFLNRNYTSYISDIPDIEKAIIGETGFYAIMNLHEMPTNIKMLDAQGNIYPCYDTIFTNSKFKPYGYIITSPFRDASTENLRLIIDDKEYFLTKD